MKMNEEIVSEEQVLFNKLRWDDQKLIINIMKTLQPCELIEDKKIEKLNNKEKVYDLTLECEHEIEKQISQDKIVDKINEIIDYINKENK